MAEMDELTSQWEDSGSAQSVHLFPRGGAEALLGSFDTAASSIPPRDLEWASAAHRGLLNSMPELSSEPRSSGQALKMEAMAAQLQQGLLQLGASQANADLPKPPPPGCAPDAIKLFVGNIPKSCTEPQLLPLFSAIGKVIDLVIVRDKATRESKGSAFLWYATRAQAETAISMFNMRYVLPDPTGRQTRPLAVRQAQNKPASSMSMAGVEQLEFALMQDAQRQQQPGSPARGAFAFPGAYALGEPPSLLGDARAPSHMEDMQTSALISSLAQALNRAKRTPGGPDSNGNSSNGNSAPLPLPLMDGLRLTDPPESGRPHSGSNVEPPQGWGGFLPMTQREQQAPPAAQQAQQPQRPRSISLSINREQLSAVSEYMHRVQGVSGAQLHISPGAAHGMFNLFVLGSPQQVDAARGLLCTILGIQP